jgi:hypothetical protein
VRNVIAFARRLTEAEIQSKAVDVNSVGLASWSGTFCLTGVTNDWLQDEREELRQTAGRPEVAGKVRPPRAQ